MFLFILPIVLVSSLTTVFTATTGMNFVIFTVGFMEWQRRKGFKGGEGTFSRREGGKHYATGMDEHSDHDLTRDLGRLAMFGQQVFEPYMGKKYDFTVSEGEMLGTIVRPAVLALDELEGAKIALEADLNNEDLQAAVFLGADNLAKLLPPIIKFLEQFPKKRIKKV